MRNHPVILVTLTLLLCLSSAPASVLYVNLNSTNPTPPFSDWTTAATNIQDAVDAAHSGDTVLVTNGIYATGGRPWFDSGSNRVTLTNAIRLQSVNGPSFTFIVGHQVVGTSIASVSNRVRCVGMGNGAVLSGFTLTNGEAGGGNYPNGGGVANITSGTCTVSNCVLIGNLATNSFGGGANGVRLFNSQIIGNSGEFGGGANGCMLFNCLIASNTATSGGGVYGVFTTGNSFLTNCTIVGNSASGTGGGAYGCTLANSIIYYNSNGTSPDCYQCTLNNCCTPVLVPANLNCISNPPDFVDPANGNYRLQIGSPCIDAGNNAFAPGPVDLDGNPRIVGAAVDMGAYENQNTNPVHYVSLTSTNPIAPFANWPTAATNIQDAVDAASAGDVILVSNGIYQIGGRAVYGTATNRLVINTAVTVQSVNGPTQTIVNGSNTVRCAYLTNGAALIGFTLTNGSASSSGDPIREESGGGIWCESTSAVVSNCLIVGNRAPLGEYAGGAFSGTLINCLLSSNSAYLGGNAASNVLINCTLADNSGYAGQGGGAFGCTMSNCTLAGNVAETGGGAYSSILFYCKLTNNGASWAAGAAYCNLSNCLLAANSGNYAAGAEISTMNNCVISNNTAQTYYGGMYDSFATNCLVLNNNGTDLAGGAAFSTLNNCLIGSNSAGQGGGAYYCDLTYCLVSNNFSRDYGAGGYQVFATACSFYGNTSGSEGGGVYSSSLNNCLLVSNVVTSFGSGGGAFESGLTNCTIVGNSAYDGAGAWLGALFNCIVYHNTYPDTFGGGNWSYCCLPSIPAGATNCITNEPAFVNLTNGDFHLQSSSPCINSGNNSYFANPTDFDGNPRIVGGTVDIGAYEYQTPTSILSYAWAQRYGIPTDGSADFADPDGDGMNNWQEWIAGLNPLDPASVLLMQSPQASSSPAGIAVSWQSVTNRTYYLQQATNLSAPPAFSTIRSNIVGQPGTTTFIDATATNGGPYFYRVGVQY